MKKTTLRGLSEHPHGGLTNALARVKGDGIYRLTNLGPGTHTVRLAFGGKVIDKVTMTVKEGKTFTTLSLKTN